MLKERYEKPHICTLLQLQRNYTQHTPHLMSDRRHAPRFVAHI